MFESGDSEKMVAADREGADERGPNNGRSGQTSTVSKLEEIIEGIYHIKIPDSIDLAKTFCRFVEYFESPEFMGKYFTLDEFEAWYTKNSPDGKVNYYEEWGQYGFCVPSHVFEPFFEGKFDPLSDKENGLLDIVNEVKAEKFVVIGTSDKTTSNIMRHEMAHGLFYLNDDYRTRVLGTLKRIDDKTREQINNVILRTGGYNKAVLDDETHACIMSELEYLREEGIAVSKIADVHKELNAIFDEFVKTAV